MPEALENCVSGMLSKWKKDPDSRPEPKKDKEGKPQDARSQAFAICTASLKKAGKLEDVELVSLEGVGPTVLGAAVTNRPHIKGLPPISVVQENETEMLLVPLLREGTYRHSSGLLKFNKDVFGTMIKNFKDNVVGNEISIDNRHKPELGANGWFKDLFVDADGILKAKVEPTPVGLQAAKEKRYRYASIEFHKDWESPEVKYMSEDMFYLEDFNEEEYEMPDETVSLAELQSERDARAALESRLQEAESEYNRRIAALEQRIVNETVKGIILEAENYRDEKNRGHPKQLVEWAAKVLRFEPIGEGEGVIALESNDNPADVREYVRKAVVDLLRSLPGSVPLEADETEREKSKNVGDDAPSGEYTTDEVEAHQEFWRM